MLANEVLLFTFKVFVKSFLFSHVGYMWMLNELLPSQQLNRSIMQSLKTSEVMPSRLNVKQSEMTK